MSIRADRRDSPPNCMRRRGARAGKAINITMINDSNDDGSFLYKLEAPSRGNYAPSKMVSGRYSFDLLSLSLSEEGEYDKTVIRLV